MPTLSIQPVRHPAKGKNRFCGPAALSIILGIDTAEASRLIRRNSGARSVTGTGFGEMLWALAKMGVKATHEGKFDVLRGSRSNNPTLAAWLRETTMTRGRDMFLVCAGWHWQVVQGRRFCCGQTGQVVSIRDDKVKRRARVTGVWRLSVADHQPTKEERAALLAPHTKPVNVAERTAAAKARALAKRHNIEIEVERWDGYSRIIVWGPSDWAMEDHEDVDPFAGDHYADDWDDALERVKQYVLLKAERPDLFKLEA